MTKEEYFARIHYQGPLDNSTFNTLYHLATFYQGIEKASNLKSGLALFIFQETEKAEKFIDISKQLLEYKAQVSLVNPE